MRIQMLTWHSNENLIRRYFVNPTMRRLIHKFEREIDSIINKSVKESEHSNLSVRKLQEYVHFRIFTLNIGEYAELIDLEILERNTKDYVLFKWELVFGKLYSRPYYMYKFSEKLAKDSEPNEL